MVLFFFVRENPIEIRMIEGYLNMELFEWSWGPWGPMGVQFSSKSLDHVLALKAQWSQGVYWASHKKKMGHLQYASDLTFVTSLTGWIPQEL